MNRHRPRKLTPGILQMYRRLSIGFVFLVAVVVLFTGCGPAFTPISKADFENQQRATGYQAPDGKNHTGAAGDGELDRIKDQISGGGGIESVSKIDRDLAARIASARVESEKADFIRVQIILRDLTRMTFDFSPKDIAARTGKDADNEVRYKGVVGKNSDGSDSGFEVSMICEKPQAEIPKPVEIGCQKSTLALKETAANGAKAGLVVRNKKVVVLAQKNPKVTVKHETLNRLLLELKSGKNATLKTFEVGWGPSGFSLNFGDSQVCPVGRLVETNDLDEPLKLNCAGAEPFRDLEGRMIGNTTRGELLLQINASTPGIIWGDSVEHIFLLVRKKPAVKKPETPPVGADPKKPTTTTPAGTATAPTAPAAASAEEEDEGDDEPVFDTDRTQDEKPTTSPGKPGETKGWLIPVNTNHHFTKTFANDRRNPIIDRGVKQWLNGSRLKTFALHFLPNRTLVTNRLAVNQVPAEMALIMFGESGFFLKKSYPVEGPMNSSAWGPWQFLDETAIGNGLRVHRRLVSKRFIQGNLCDERADLGKSSEAAGRYLRGIINMFPNDPKLVLLGYNQGEYGVQSKVTSLKNTGSKERLAAIKEIGLNYWTIRKFNMASAGGIKYVENFVSVYHAALESDPVALDPSIEPWKPNPQCRTQ